MSGSARKCSTKRVAMKPGSPALPQGRSPDRTPTIYPAGTALRPPEGLVQFPAGLDDTGRPGRRFRKVFVFASCEERAAIGVPLPQLWCFSIMSAGVRSWRRNSVPYMHTHSIHTSTTTPPHLFHPLRSLCCQRFTIGDTISSRNAAR